MKAAAIFLLSIILLIFCEFGYAAAETDDFIIGQESIGNLSNYNYSYSPSTFVRAFHGVPHIGSDGQKNDGVFNITESNRGSHNSYVRSVIGVPIIIGVVLVILIALLALVILGGFKAICELGPGEEKSIELGHSKEEIREWKKSTIEGRKFWKYCFFVASAMLLVGNNVPLLGDVLFARGTRLVEISMEHIQSQVGIINVHLDHINDNLKLCQHEITFSSVACPEAQPLIADVTALSDQLNSFSALVDRTEAYAVKGRDSIFELEMIESSLFWLFYAVILATNIMFLVGYFSQHFTWITITIIASKVILLFFIAMTTCEFILLISGGDFCMDPIQNVVSSLKPGDVKNIASYYGTCTGRNPLHTNLAVSYATRDVLSRGINGLYNPNYDAATNSIKVINANPNPICDGNANLQLAFYYLAVMRYDYQDIAAKIGCESNGNKAIFHSTFEVALCDKMYEGLFWLWLSQMFTILSIYILVLTSAILTLYFASWDTHSEHKSLEEEEADLDESTSVDQTETAPLVMSSSQGSSSPSKLTA